MFAKLKKWWQSFDASGRKFMNSGFPMLGSHKMEQKFLAEAKRQQEERGRDNG